MTRNEIQETRMRGYFIQAASEILRSEGMRALSVRNIADRAGYSYATLYNYFKDVRELIFECVKVFMDEARTMIETERSKVAPGLPGIRRAAETYAMFFVQYPGVFNIFFTEKPNEIAGAQPTLALIYSFLDEICASDWKQIEESGSLPKAVISSKKDSLRFSLAGILLLYLNRRMAPDYSAFKKMLNKELDNILSM